MKGVPKTRIYRIIRRGEVRVNGSRCRPADRLAVGDRVRLPPIRSAATKPEGDIPLALQGLERRILHLDDHLLVIDKPAGVAVHGGSGIPVGLIEALKQTTFRGEYLELAHRLDRDTSGCLLLARERGVLLELHRMFRREGMAPGKHYTALLHGAFPVPRRWITDPLRRYRDSVSGQSRVSAGEGQPARTLVEVRARYPASTLVALRLETGRMHQARVHCASAGYPVLGDDTYGDRPANRAARRAGLRRLFLHATRLELRHPVSGERLAVTAPLAAELKAYLEVAAAADVVPDGE